MSKINQTVGTNSDAPPTDALIPIASGGLILLAILVSDLNYWLLEELTTLLFYAVLVQMWSGLLPDNQSLVRGPFTHAFFLFISVGAVSLGTILEHGIEWLGGVVLPAQLLAIAVLASRIYLRCHETSRISAVLLWQNQFERYVILIPCLLVITLPIAVHQLGISGFWLLSPRLFVSQTSQSFLALVSTGLGAGLLLYMYVEEYWSK